MHAVNWWAYVELSAVFFLEFAVSGAWMPVLAARLLGPLKFSGKQTGWIYATLPLASLIAIPLAGHLADKYYNLEWIMVASHAVGRCCYTWPRGRRSSAACFSSCFSTACAMRRRCRWPTA